MMEARKQPRANLALRPEYFSPSEREFVDGKTHDISAGGMFIEAERMIPSGTLIKIRCEPGAGELIEGVAKVVWNRPRAADTGPAGIGVKFIKLKGDSERVLQRLVEGGMVAAPSEPASTSGSAPSEPATAAAAESTNQSANAPTSATAATEPAEAADAAVPATASSAEPASAEPAIPATPTTKTISSRPSAAELSARLEKARASIPSPAPADAASPDKPVAATRSETAAEPARGGTPPPSTHTSEAARESEVVVPHQATPIYLLIGGLLAAIAALAAWLLSR